ncbi:hypothetical protein Ndes2437B_g01074 [Nannochloris sp. 'desiccata']
MNDYVGAEVEEQPNAKKPKPAPRAEKTLNEEEKEKLKGFIIDAHKAQYHIETNKMAKGYPTLAREMMLDEYPADKHPEANARIKLALSDGQAVLSKMKALFGSGNAAAGFEHVIAAETAKATEMAAKAEAQKLDDELGYNAPAVEAPGKDCVAWIKQFMGDKMQQRSDGQWEFLVEGFTKTKVKTFYTRLQHWKNNPNSTSYLATYKTLQAALSNALQILDNAKVK